MLATAQIPSGIQSVRFYGELAERFGAEIEIFANTTARALLIIEANFPRQFFKALAEGEYFVWVSGKDGDQDPMMTQDEVLMQTNCTRLHIMPSIEGASNNKGGLMAILGMVLVGAAIVASGGLAAGGIAAALSGMSGTIWGTVAQLGLGMTLSGIGMMLSPMPKMDLDTDNQRKTSYTYSGAVNILNEGGAIPLCYGKPFVNSTVISGGLFVENIATAFDGDAGGV